MKFHKHNNTQKIIHIKKIRDKYIKKMKKLLFDVGENSVIFILYFFQRVGSINANFYI
jgi:predicted RNA-binding protein with RPS1 domain